MIAEAIVAYNHIYMCVFLYTHQNSEARGSASQLVCAVVVRAFNCTRSTTQDQHALCAKFAQTPSTQTKYTHTRSEK